MLSKTVETVRLTASSGTHMRLVIIRRLAPVLVRRCHRAVRACGRGAAFNFGDQGPLSARGATD
jgi:hypothetical protein